MTQPLPPYLVPLPPSDPAEVEEDLWSGFSGKLAFDIGARRGENISYLCRLGFRRVVACEPQSVSFAELVNRFGQLENAEHFRVTLRNQAISDFDGPLDLAAVPHCMSKGELVTPYLMGMEWEPDDWSQVKLVSVRAITLDTLAGFDGAPDLVVIDTEGHEAKILKGGTDLIASGRCSFLIEFHAPGLADSCRDILEISGYETTVIRHPHYAPESPMWFQHGWLKAFAPKPERHDSE